MANPINWLSSAVSRGAIMTSADFGGITNGSFGSLGSAVNNAANLDQYGQLEFLLCTSGMTAGGYVNCYRSVAMDGTNYTSTVDPAVQLELVTALQLASSTGIQRLASKFISMPPHTMKFMLENKTGLTLLTTGVSVNLYTFNDELQ